MAERLHHLWLNPGQCHNLWLGVKCDAPSPPSDLTSSQLCDYFKRGIPVWRCARQLVLPVNLRTFTSSTTKTTMAGSTPARLKVILGENNIEKLTLPNGIPESLEDLLSTIKTTFGLKGNFRLQYMDQDFGNDFFNLNSTTELRNLGTIKVIHQQTNPPLISADQSTSSLSLSFESDDGISVASNDTIILSSPESMSSRTQQWPEDFAIPQFSYDTELQLERGNTEYRVSQKMLTLSARMLSDILKRVAEEIYRYKAYPEDAHFCAAAEALIKKHPCLKEPGSFNGCYGWKQRLKYKMANYRTQLKLQGCPELCVNSLKSKATTDAFPAKKVKKPKRSEANFYPSFPTGETLDSMEKVRLELLTEIGIRDNERVIADKMANTFTYRRHEVVNQEPSIQELKDR
uniref:PB1 domain-containing protein n=1 Tax=Maylandia zebra TaxID=106582 RepID=A0A3P9DJI5_9CICH